MGSAVVIGVGPGIGLSVARRCSAEGLPVGLVARSGSTLEEAQAQVDGPTAIATADAADADALRTALDSVIGEVGAPELLVYNVGLIQQDAIDDLTPAEHQHAWAVNVVGAITAAAHVLPAMAERGRGTYLLTGGMPVPDPDLVSLSLGKAGLRALTQLLDTQYGAQGIHVATVTVGGEVAPGGDYDPDDIADRYWDLHRQTPEHWQREVVHGPSRA